MLPSPMRWLAKTAKLSSGRGELIVKRNRGEAGPSRVELRAIEAEWPVIVAEMELVDAEVVVLLREGRPSALDRARLVRAARRVVEARRVLAVPAVTDRVVA